MDVISRFSSSQNRRDQGPNRKFALEIAKSQSKESIQKILEILESNPKKEIERDALLCLAALSEFDPKLLSGFAERIFPFLSSKTNMSVWGAMISLSGIAPYRLDFMMQNLSQILKAMDEGTVITRDSGFVILIHLFQHPDYRSNIFPLILEQLHSAPDNQLGQYAEKFMDVMSTDHKEELEQVLANRQQYLEKEAHRKRLAKIMKKLWKK